MSSRQPAILIAGTHSGCGKTTATLGIMAALTGRGLRVQPFKCGPDFIDPTLHHQVTGIFSRNLDVRMCGEEYVRHTFSEFMNNCDIGIIEGVMGLFDGGDGSAAHLAKLLNIPVILVIDVRSAAESVAAVVKGFETLDSNVRIAGVILNRVGSSRHRQMITDAVEKHCQSEIIGILPRNPKLAIPSRHLGLHMGDEHTLNTALLENWITDNVDLMRLTSLAGKRKALQAIHHKQPVAGTASFRLGVARDEAFCFYYEDNLDIFRQNGCEIIPISPLRDQALPDDLDGLYLGGGYPELFAEQLSANTEMLESVRQFSKSMLPLYAECGGFMYLTREIADLNGTLFPMAGVYPVTSRLYPRLRRLGYRKVELQCATFLGQTGSLLHGHEFHYSDIDEMPPEIVRAYTLDDGREEGYLVNNTLGGYLHLHFGGTPQACSTFFTSTIKL